MADEPTISTESAAALVPPELRQPGGEDVALSPPGPPKRKRGRPKGSRNKPKAKDLNSSTVKARAGGWKIVNGGWQLDRGED